MADPQVVREARRALGQKLAGYRQAKPLSQQGLADLTAYGRSSVANVEAGLQSVNRAFWESADSELDAEGELLRGYDKLEALRRAHQRPAGRTPRSGDVTAQPVRGVDGIRAGWAHSVGAPVVLPAQAGEARSAERRYHRPRSSGQPTPAGDVAPIRRTFAFGPASEPADRVRHGLADPARYGDEQFVNACRVQLETAKSLDGRYGALAALSTAKGVIDVVEAVTPDVSEEVRDHILVLGAEAAEFIGWLFRDLADPVQAGYWYDRAMEYAQMCGDLSMQGFVLLRKSQMAYESRSVHQVWLLARASIEGPWQLPPAFYAEALLQVARGDLMVGRSVDLEGVVEQAGEAAAGENLTLREASCWIEARQPERAAQLYEDGISVAGLSVRDGGYFRARHAFALAQAETPDLAAGRAHEALITSVRTGSRRTHRAVLAARTALTPWESRDAVKALDDALSLYASSMRQQLRSPGPATPGFAG